VLLTAPETPLLFMGQEWAATAPFLYFTDHDEDLGKIVAEGRRREFRHFVAFIDPEARARIPDPQALSTFARCRLEWVETERAPHDGVVRLYRSLLRVRRSEPALRSSEAGTSRVVAWEDETLILVRRPSGPGPVVLVVARLRGSGWIDLAAVPGLGLDVGAPWKVLLTTEEPAFSASPAAPQIDLSSESPRIRFAGPAAVVFRGRG
jgi:maltooligosyltrehalose trehalohydrolase